MLLPLLLSPSAELDKLCPTGSPSGTIYVEKNLGLTCAVRYNPGHLPQDQEGRLAELFTDLQLSSSCPAAPGHQHSAGACIPKTHSHSHALLDPHSTLAAGVHL